MRLLFALLTCAFSDSQLRLLSLARLALHGSQYRLVLIDEPPARQLAKLAKRNSESPIAGEKGTTVDKEKDEEEDEEIDISGALKAAFPSATVIIAAHHASTLK